MGYGNFKIFFDKNIKQYHPYSNNIIYSTLMSFLLDPFLKDSYSNIPQKFIDLFEQQIVSSDIYDSLLISLGYPKTFIASVSTFHKKTILNKFTNYYKYKGTLNHFKDICIGFNEPVNLYELYITKKNEEYVFIPKKIYESNIEYDKKDLKYDAIYNSVPNYFISKDLIEKYDDNKAIIFPIKSNLLYFVISENLDCSDIVNLIMSITLHHYRNSKISILIYDNIYTFTLTEIFQLWSYLLNLYSSNADPNKISSVIVYYDINANCPYTFENIDLLITAYENIQTLSDSYDFINTYIKPYFSSYPALQILSIDEFRNILLYSIDSRIINQIETNVSTSKNISQELFSILSGILTSIQTWILNNSEVDLLKYKKYILNAFYLPFLNMDSSIVYKLIDLFKPYHTSICSNITSNIIYKSKLETLVLEDDFRMATD